MFECGQVSCMFTVSVIPTSTDHDTESPVKLGKIPVLDCTSTAVHN